MRKVLLFALCFLFFLSISAAQVEESNPRNWDFGRIRVAGGIVKHTFILENDTKDDLHIESIHASCGCTISEIDRKVIPPRESAALEVRFNPKGYFGKVTQFVYVNTDSVTTPVYKFVIMADIVRNEIE